MTRRLASAPWGLAMLGLVLVVWFDQLVRRAELQQLRWVVLGTVLAAALSLVHTTALALGASTVEPARASLWTLPRPYQEAKMRAWPPEPFS